MFQMLQISSQMLQKSPVKHDWKRATESGDMDVNGKRSERSFGGMMAHSQTAACYGMGRDGDRKKTNIDNPGKQFGRDLEEIKRKMANRTWKPWCFHLLIFFFFFEMDSSMFKMLMKSIQVRGNCGIL